MVGRASLRFAVCGQRNAVHAGSEPFPLERDPTRHRMQ